jgi:hypothetical protein
MIRSIVDVEHHQLSSSVRGGRIIKKKAAPLPAPPFSITNSELRITNEEVAVEAVVLQFPIPNS